MKRFICYMLVAQSSLATTSEAAPCVGNTFDIDLPGATDVISHLTDVPSVLFPAFWQEGLIAGFSYQIFSNGDASILPSQLNEDWTIDLTCRAVEQMCDTRIEGSPSDDVVRVVELLSSCLLGEDTTAESSTEISGTLPAFGSTTEQRAR